MNKIYLFLDMCLQAEDYTADMEIVNDCYDCYKAMLITQFCTDVRFTHTFHHDDGKAITKFVKSLSTERYIYLYLGPN